MIKGCTNSHVKDVLVDQPGLHIIKLVNRRYYKMADTAEEDIIEMPREGVMSSCGFALDIGGSTAKLVYRAKWDLDYNNNTENKYGKLRVKLLPKHPDDDLLKFIERNCDVTKNSDTSVFYGTGLATGHLADRIKTKFNISRVEILSEIDCFSKAMNSLYTEGRDIFLSRDDSAQKAGSEMAAGIEGTMKQLNTSPTEDVTATQGGHVEQSDDTHPFIMIMLGSGFAFVRVEKDGSNKVYDGMLTGGKSFLGMAAVMTGVRDFDTLMTMASRGDSTKVDTVMRDLKESTGDIGVYAGIPDDMTVYCFSKPAEGGTYSSDDIVRSLLRLTCSQIGGSAQVTSDNTGISRVFFVGAFARHPLVRKLISMQLQIRSSTFAKKKNTQYEFVKHGAFLGALGAYFHESNNN